MIKKKMVLCAIFGCATRSGRDKGINMARIPSVITSRGEEVRKLSEERRNKWISAISSEDLTDNILNHGRVCGKHFIPGKTAELWSRYDPDWFPTQHLGHQSCGSVEKLCQLKHVAEERERQLGEEIESKKQKLYEPGENVIENCFDVESAVGTMPSDTGFVSHLLRSK